MRLKRVLSKWFMLLAVTALVAGAVAPLATGADHAYAQSQIALQVSIPSLWENTITADLLAEFEAQHSGVKVYLTVNDDISFFGFGGGGISAIDDELDSTEEFVSTADVLYVSPTSLSNLDTQAGYYLDLAPLVMSDPALDASDFIPAVWESYQWDNGMWALPLSTDVVIMTYDPVAFDEAGLAYPNERWTVDDFANAARQLAVYGADGAVDTPGFTTVSGGNNQDLLLRALVGASLYSAAAVPNTPDFSAVSSSLEYILSVWYELMDDGVISAQGGGRDTDIPLRIEGINGYADRFGGFNRDNQDTETRYASLLPGGVAGLTVQGFAVSAATQYPELSYELAKFLSGRSELASNNFSVSPARYSLITTAATTNTNEPGQPGQGGGPGMGNRTIPEEIQPVVDQSAGVGLPVSELRYAEYLSSMVTEMLANGGDALTALQTIEAQAATDVQTAQARNGTVTLFIPPPVTGPTLSAGEIMLNCAVNQGFGGGRGGQLPNQDQWDQLIDEFVASDPVVGAVNLEMVMDTDLAVLAENYDCVILSSNAVPDGDLSMVLNLDPLIDTDTTFDRNDVIGNTLAQLQKDNKTWALPLAVTPQMLEYDPEQFAWAGVPEPANGWTTDAFVDALRMLKPYDTDPAPFVPNDPSGSYLLMLIAAFGGLPIDYRTDPVTINFTDAGNVDAIRQVLDLVADGYIAFSELEDIFELTADAAITSNTFNQFRVNFGGANAPADTRVTTTYPQGTQYSVIAYEITTGYVSALAQNPEATYRFLSAVALSPSLFSGMPARGSLVSDPDVIASQGEEIAAVYQQIDALLTNANTIVFPTFTQGRGGATSFIQSYWLTQAFNAYITDGADLEQGLADAELMTQAYLECEQGIVPDTSITDVREQQRAFAEQIMTCAMGVDPNFGS